jgi:hypothetical protein
MLIGYNATTWHKIATQQDAAMKALSTASAGLVARRLSQLAAFDNLGQIRRRAPPLYLLTRNGKGQANRAGEFVIRLHGDDGIVFRPTGEYTKLRNGKPDINTVTQVEITLIGNHRGRSQ